MREKSEEMAESRLKERHKKLREKIIQRKQRRVELIGLRSKRTNHAEVKKHIKGLKQMAKTLVRKVVWEWHAAGNQSDGKTRSRKKVPIASFQFVAEIMLECFSDAVEVGINRVGGAKFSLGTTDDGGETLPQIPGVLAFFNLGKIQHIKRISSLS